jgi:DedD protein
MEQKKLLLVAISVGVFLVIVIGAAILAFGPGNSASSAVMAAAPGARSIPAGPAGTFPDPFAGEAVQRTPVDAVDLLRHPGAVPGLQPAPDGAPLQQNNFYINGSPERLPSEEPGQTVITVAPRTAAGVPDVPPAGRAASQAPAGASNSGGSSQPRAQTPASQAPAVRPAPAVASAQARPAPATAAARAPAQTKVYDDYWVQTGSFSAKARAEGVKETLASKGIVSIIENREVEGKTFFRVRVGPYTSQNEADYWLSLIKTISGFEESQVWKSQSRR